jgi:hypothetical protein
MEDIQTALKEKIKFYNYLVKSDFQLKAKLKIEVESTLRCNPQYDCYVIDNSTHKRTIGAYCTFQDLNNKKFINTPWTIKFYSLKYGMLEFCFSNQEITDIQELYNKDEEITNESLAS